MRSEETASSFARRTATTICPDFTECQAAQLQIEHIPGYEWEVLSAENLTVYLHTRAWTSRYYLNATNESMKYVPKRVKFEADVERHLKDLVRHEYHSKRGIETEI